MIIVDTDILIDCSRKYKEAISFIEKNEGIMALSIYSKFELIAGCNNKKELGATENFLSRFKILSSNETITSEALNIFINYTLKYGIESFDSLIASSSIFYNMVLYTKNIKHYKNIKGLKVKRPYK